MKQKAHHIMVDESGEFRVDIYLAKHLPDVSRSQIKNLIDLGQVCVDGLLVEKAGMKVKTGSLVEINLPDDESDGLIPEDLPLEVLFENEQIIVINKAAGMVVHPGAGTPCGTVVNALLSYYPPIRFVGEEDRPGVVHRLDKDTSGVLLFAKTNEAYRWLIKQFKSREMRKTYLALVDGHPPTPTGRIEAPIERDTRIRTRMAVGLQGRGKQAISEYFERQSYQEHALLEVHPITGRTHQIRVHLSYIGIPVVGDTLYGRRHPSINIDRFFLHAYSLSLRLPGDRTHREFIAPLPKELQVILEKLEQYERLL
jgi:23S rRNA pseudouridine1911/1915/1917 synthase